MAMESLVRSAGVTPQRPLVLVTGAGVSVASGIPTFRGPRGYWTVGSREYHPQEMATRAAFQAMPREVWRWYLYRRHVCNSAEPNAAHRSAAAIEAVCGDAFAVLTQNVDGLHVRGGCSEERVFEVHGSIDVMRDLESGVRLPLPEHARIRDRGEALSDDLWNLLVNPATGARCRPHVLWFDEAYDEENYRFYSAMGLAAAASLVVVCGTSGAANVPHLAVREALLGGASLIDISPDDNPFRELASRLGDRGLVYDGTAVDGLDELARSLGARP